jgi:hypothetical protein
MQPARNFQGCILKLMWHGFMGKWRMLARRASVSLGQRSSGSRWVALCRRTAGPVSTPRARTASTGHAKTNVIVRRQLPWEVGLGLSHLRPNLRDIAPGTVATSSLPMSTPSTHAGGEWVTPEQLAHSERTLQLAAAATRLRALNEERRGC